MHTVCGPSRTGGEHRGAGVSGQTGKTYRELRRIAGLRNLLVGTVAAFGGGALVVGVQAVLARAGARYPPIVQGLHCNFIRPAGPGATTADVVPEAEIGADSAELAVPQGQGSRLLPVITAGDEMTCHADAPGADYAAWSVAGRFLQYRSGPLEPTLSCQNQDAFAAQSPDDLRLSTCQRFTLTDPGVYTLVVKVMARGFGGVDREQLQFRVRPAPPAAAAPAPEPPIGTRVTTKLLLPARKLTQERSVPVSESLNEHGLLPSSRDYSWVVYRLAAGESYVSARFQANSASNASKTKISYQPNARTVSVSFTLRSGPFMDRWRGWLSGSVVIKLSRQDPARTVDLPDIDLQVPGEARARLPDNVPADRLGDARLALVRSETGTSREVALGEKLMLDDVELSATVLEGNLVIDAARPVPVPAPTVRAGTSRSSKG